MLIIIPIPGLVLLFQDLVGILPKSSLDYGNSFIIYANINAVILIISFAFYHLFKRRASIALFNIKPFNLLYELQTPLLQIPAVLIFGFIPMIVASYNLLMDNISSTVTPKGKSELKIGDINNP
jgi:hypothetical protein